MGCSTSKQARRGAGDGDEDVVERSIERIETRRGGGGAGGGKDGDIARVNQYKIEAFLGKGAFGAVYRAVDEVRNEMVAVKVMNKAELRKKSKAIGGRGPPKPKETGVSMTLLKEIAVMKRVQHPNCVRLFEVIDDAMGDRMFLIMELLTGGEVMAPGNLPAGQEYLDEAQARAVFRSLLDGLEYLHGNGILHRDIKPENIVYESKPPFGRGAEGSVVGAIGASMVKAGYSVAKGIGDSTNALASSILDAVPLARTASTCTPSAPTADAPPADGATPPTSAPYPAMVGAAAVATAEAPSAAAAATKPKLELSGPVGVRRLLSGAQPSPRESIPSVMPQAKLLDFGVSQMCVDALVNHADDAAVVRRGFDDSILKATGTPAFYAPEMLVGKPFHGKPADVWASGVTLAFLVSGAMPFW